MTLERPRLARISSPRLSLPLGIAGVLFAQNAMATDYYVATTGSDSGAGTMAAPFATLQKGANVAAAGDTVYIRGGTYMITTPTSSSAGISLSKSGTSDTNRINFFAYPGEVPVFNFSKMNISSSGYTHGLVVTGSWLHLKGLEVCYVPENSRSNNGVEVLNASNDIFEELNMHHNQGNGIFVNAGNGGHLILNCDGHDNYDPTSTQGQGQNADGFGVHYQTAGTSTTIRGCRSWWNSDDGYDLIGQEYTVIVENSFAMGNGTTNSGTTRPSAGNGNGFKMGSSKTGVRHIVRDNVAWKNTASGFYANHSTGGNTWYNNTSYDNGTQFNMLASPAGQPDTTITLSGSLAHLMRNNVGFPNKNANMTGVDSASNTWDLNITPQASDFASIDDTGVTGPRQADGTVPNTEFMKLASASPLIDKGTNVGLPYVGTAPDLGAFEYGATVTTGGTSGASSLGDASSASGSSASGASGTADGTSGSAAGDSTSGAGSSGVDTTVTSGDGNSASGATGPASGATEAAQGGASSGDLGAGQSGATATTPPSESGGGTPESHSSGGGCTIARAPSSSALFGAGFAGLVVFGLRRRQKRS